MKVKKIAVFFSPNCSFCHKEIEWLEEQQIVFEKKNVEEPKNLDEFKERKGQGYPLNVLTLENNEQVEVLGFNKSKLEKYLL